MLTLLILYLACGSLLVALSLPLLLDKIPPNPLYGFRIAKTLQDPRVWYAGNRYAAKWFIIAGASIVLSALLLYFVPGISADVYALGCLAVFVIFFTFGLVQSLRFIKRF